MKGVYRTTIRNFKCVCKNIYIILFVFFFLNKLSRFTCSDRELFILLIILFRDDIFFKRKIEEKLNSHLD